MAGAVPVFTAVNGAILPVPVAARPIFVLSLVHENVVVPPVLFVEKMIAAV